MTAIDTQGIAPGTELAPTSDLAMPPRFRGRLPFRKFLRLIRESSIATYPVEAFEADIFERNFLWRRNFVVNQPDAIGRVMLDNAATTARAR